MRRLLALQLVALALMGLAPPGLIASPSVQTNEQTVGFEPMACYDIALAGTAYPLFNYTDSEVWVGETLAIPIVTKFVISDSSAPWAPAYLRIIPPDTPSMVTALNCDAAGYPTAIRRMDL
jgi:hypothetical protein